MTNSINKFYGINNTETLVTLIDQLHAKSHCCGVKFTKSGEKSGTTYTLNEIFRHVDTESAKSRAFVNRELVISLKKMVKNEVNADRNDAPKWSFKWLVGLLLQLGRTIVRFLCNGCKTVNYTAKLEKLEKSVKEHEESELPQLEFGPSHSNPAIHSPETSVLGSRFPITSSLPESELPVLEFGPSKSNTETVAIHSSETSVLGLLFSQASPPNPPTVVLTSEASAVLNDSDKTEQALQKAEREEILTQAEYDHLLQTLTTLDLTKWKNPIRVSVKRIPPAFTPGDHNYEWMAGFLSSCKKLKTVRLPADKPVLIEWLILDPFDRRKGDTRQIAMYGKIHNPPKGWNIDYSSSLNAKGRYALFYNRDIKFEFDMPVLDYQWINMRGGEELSVEELDRLYKYVDTPEKYEQLLAVSFPKAKDWPVAMNLQKILKKNPNLIIRDLGKYFHTLFDEKSELSEHWKPFLQSLPWGSEKQLYTEMLNSTLRNTQHMNKESRKLAFQATLQKTPIRDRFNIMQSVISKCEPHEMAFLMETILDRWVFLMAAIDKGTIKQTELQESTVNQLLICRLISAAFECETFKRTEKIKSVFGPYWKMYKEIGDLNNEVRDLLKYLITKEDINAFLSSASEAGLFSSVPQSPTTEYKATELESAWLTAVLAHSTWQTVRDVGGPVGGELKKVPRQISRKEIAELLENYPQLCLKMTSDQYAEIFPDPEQHDNLKRSVIAKAKKHAKDLFLMLEKAPAEALPNEVRKIILGYDGFALPAINEAETEHRQTT